MNMVLLAAAFVGVSVYVALSRRPMSGYRPAFAWAERVGLPLDDAQLRARVVRRFRAARLLDGSAMLIAIVVAAAFLPTTWGGSVLLVLVVLLPVGLLLDLVATLALGLRDHVFAPSAESPRIARMSPLTVADYLGQPRRLTLGVVSTIGIVAMIVVVTVSLGSPESVRADLAVIALGVGVAAIVTLTQLPRFDLAILERSQPASTLAELAWDDSLRAGMLGTVRRSIAVAFIVVLALAIGALSAGSDSTFGVATQVALWGQLLLQQIYPSNGIPRPRTHLAQEISA